LAPPAAMAMGRDKKNALKFLGGGATIRIDREMLCLPYAGFYIIVYIAFTPGHSGYAIAEPATATVRVSTCPTQHCWPESSLFSPLSGWRSQSAAC
jgi:hypothetical protein